MSKLETATPLDALWKTDDCSADQKLVLYHLMTKHPLSQRTAVAYKTLGNFLSDFKDHWCDYDELRRVTQLSDVKLERALHSLEGSDLIRRGTTAPDPVPETEAAGADEQSQQPEVASPTHPSQNPKHFCITTKLFTNYAGEKPTQRPGKSH